MAATASVSATAALPSAQPVRPTGPGQGAGSFEALRASSRAKLTNPPTTPPDDALAAEGGVRWQLVTNGHEAPLRTNDALTADVTVWKSDGTKVTSTFDRPVAATIKLTSVGEEFQGLLQRLKPPAVARYWIPKQAHKSWHPQSWPDDDVVVQVNAYMVARSDEPLGGKGPKPAASGPPADAQTAANGYRYQILERGTSKPVPRAEPITLVWSAWVIEGLVVRKLTRGTEKTDTTLDKVPGGLGPVVASMTLGETRRIWVPKDQAGAIAPKAKGLDLVIDLLVHQ